MVRSLNPFYCLEPRLEDFFLPLLFFFFDINNFFIATLIEPQCAFLSVTLSPPLSILHVYTHMQTLLRKRGKGMGGVGREEKI